MLRDSGVRFVAADIPDANDLTIGVLAVVAQAEREAISRRTKEGLAAIKGKRPSWTAAQAGSRA
jgi:DNA invertase Pin-like site-specific DNA recombinase